MLGDGRFDLFGRLREESGKRDPQTRQKKREGTTTGYYKKVVQMKGGNEQLHRAEKKDEPRSACSRLLGEADLRKGPTL